MTPTKEEIHETVVRGEEWYETQIRAQVEADNFGKYLVIDVTTGHYEIDSNHISAVERARASNPNADLYSMRVGFPALGKMGGGWNMKLR